MNRVSVNVLMVSLGLALAAPLVAGPSDPAVLSDPLRPAITTRAVPADAAQRSAPSYTLSAIKRDGPRSHAIVNATLVHVGDRLGDAQVRRIDRRSVDLSTVDGPLTLRFNDLEIKRHVDPRPVTR